MWGLGFRVQGPGLCADLELEVVELARILDQGCQLRCLAPPRLRAAKKTGDKTMFDTHYVYNVFNHIVLKHCTARKIL